MSVYILLDTEKRNAIKKILEKVHVLGLKEVGTKKLKSDAETFVSPIHKQSKII